jgi:rifampicin phosphotransferase
MGLGGKAEGLAWLTEAGERVPPYIVVGLVPGAVPPEEALAVFDRTFAATETVAVRSSAFDEDGLLSRAGHYLTRLDVARADLPAAVAEVLASVGDGTAVVQQMVPAELSVVLFTANPLGLRNEAVVTVATGVGTAVSDETPATTGYVNLTDGQAWTESPPGAPELPGWLLDEVVATGRRLQAHAGHPLDVELAVLDREVWVLQARPITTLGDGPSVTLDSSNIVESYPGLVSPLTASFVPLAYEGVFRSLAQRITRDPLVVGAYADTVRAMVQAHSGRMYYRIDNWYRLMRLVPAARWYIRVWQDSLGVTEREYDEPPITLGRLARISVGVRLLRELAAVPRGLVTLRATVEAERASFPARLAACNRPSELGVVFERLHSRLFSRWDVTLLNDVRAFVFPALVQTWLTVRRDGDPAGHTRALVSTGVLESLQPLRELRRFAADAPSGLAAMDDDDARKYVNGPGEYPARLRAYLAEYGDRCFEELKLESVTLRQDPALLVRLLVAGALGPTAETAPQTQPRDPVLRLLVAKARAAIAGRESSRMDRTRVYGMARDLVVRSGELAAAAGRLDAPRDVFWLTLDEAFRDGGDLRGAIAARRRDQAAFALLPYYRRLVFTGEPFDRRPTGSVTLAAAVDATPGRFTGTAVSGGTVTGPVRIVTDPGAVRPGAGDVLVTTMTDPGWVFLLAGAGAVIAERGSPLSHTAIVARELGVPMVVGVHQATRLLRDGDVVEVDGTAGIVRVVEQEPGQ